MAKFKVGDKVYDMHKPPSKRKVLEVMRVAPGGIVVWSPETGRYDAYEKQLVLANAASRNAVVNAVACNWGSLKIGTRVEVDGRKGTIVANPGNLTRYTVKYDDGKVGDTNSLAPYFKVIGNAITSKNAVVNAALNATACNADVKKALNGKIVCNGIGDCFADAVFDLEKAVKMAGKAGAKSLIKEAKDDVAYVTSYDWADTKDKQYMKKCLSAIDKALSNPTEEAITAARWECEKARAYADGGSPSRAFWNSDSCNEVAKNELSGLTPEQNKMNAESKNLRLAARSNLMR